MPSSTATKPIVVVGTCNLDFALLTDHLPANGETVLGDLQIAGGGKAANQAVAAARLGGEVSFVTRVGDDANGEVLLDGLRGDGVGVDSVTTVEGGDSGTALIFVDNKGQVMIGVAEGVNRHMEPGDLDRCEALGSADAVVLAEMGIPLAVIEALGERQAQVGFRFIFNPAPVVGELSEGCWRAIDIITPNETEAEALTGIAVTDDESALAAARALVERGARVGVVTLGERGVAYATAEDAARMPAFEVEAVDTTSASDSFSGGLAVALQRGDSLEDALRYGQAVAALCVTRGGAQTSLPTAAEVDEFLAGQTSPSVS
jgi:ribokinase